MYIFLLIVLSFFAVIGVVQFIYAIIDIVLMRDDADEYLLVIPHPDANSAEMQLRSAVSRAGKLYGGRVIVLCDDLSQETAHIIDAMHRERGNIETMTRSQMADIIKSGSG